MFFTIFEVTRRVASDLRSLSKNALKDDDKYAQKYIPPVFHAVILVTGGVRRPHHRSTLVDHLLGCRWSGL